jgi:hypothetical protein
LGGDSASIRSVAAWFRDILAPRVDGAASAVAHIQRARLESWDDIAGRAFAGRLSAGQPKIDAFAAAIRRRADLLDEIAAVLEYVEGQMAAADELAEINHLRKEDGWIWAPMLGESRDGRPEDNMPEALRGYYLARREIYREVEELVGSAYAKVGEKLMGNESYDWNQLTFVAGDLVKEDVAELVRRHNPHHSSAVMLALTRKPTPSPVATSARPYGLTARVLTVGGPILTLTGAAYDLYSGSPPERVVLTTGVGLGAGAFAVWFIPEIIAGPPAWAVAAGATAFAFLLSQGAGWVYDDGLTAREKLLNTTPDINPGHQSLPN